MTPSFYNKNVKLRRGNIQVEGKLHRAKQAEDLVLSICERRKGEDVVLSGTLLVRL